VAADAGVAGRTRPHANVSGGDDRDQPGREVPTANRGPHEPGDARSIAAQYHGFGATRG